MRVVTYNIWNVEGDWKRRGASLVEVLQEAAPEILGVQEASQSDTVASQAEELAEALGMEMVCWLLPFPHRGEGFRMGNAVLSRRPITEWDQTALPSPRNNRSCIRAQVETAHGMVQVFVAHLSADLDQGELRESQVGHLLDWSAAFAGDPCFLLGDFNAAPDTAEIRRMPAALPPWLDTWTAVQSEPGLTSVRANPYRAHRTKPNRRVDYVFMRDPEARWRPTSGRLIGDSPVRGLYPSDHFGVCVDLEFCG